MLTTVRQDDSMVLERRVRLWLWVAVALAVLTMLGFRIAQINRRARETAQWQAQIKTIDQASQASQVRLKDLYNQHVLKWTRADLESAINDAKPFAVSKTTATDVETTWKDPASGRPFEFSFSLPDQKWRGIGTRWGPNYLPAQPGPSALEGEIEQLRRSFAGFNSGAGPLLWIVLFVGFWVLRRWRPVLGEALLAMAILCTAAWLIHPGYSLSPRGIFSNDMLFWGAVMLVTSSFMFWSAKRVRTPEFSIRCPACQYSLVGNVSGVCPECGTRVPEEIRNRVSEEAAAT